MNKAVFDYFGARYYDSDLSVWLSVDPLAFKYPHESPYSYVGNRPINTIDPWGMDKIEDPNGNSGEAGDYKQTGDKKYLYGDGLKTKVWDPNYDGGGNRAGGPDQKGGYVDYEGDAINFGNYGKLSGGKFDGQEFNSIETGSGSDWYGSYWSTTKTQFKNADYATYSDAAHKDLVKWGKAAQTVGLLGGGVSTTGGIRNILKKPKEFIKGLTPMTLMMTHLYMTGVKTEQAGKEFQNIFMNYSKLHGDDPGLQQGVYLIEIFFSAPIPMGGGSSTFHGYYFYDISTGKFLGSITYP